MNAAGAVADADYARAGLAAGAHLGDVKPGRDQPCPRRVGVRNAPAQAPQFVVAVVGAGRRPVHDFYDETAAPEKHLPAPVLMRAVERHVELETRAIECGGTFR